MRASGELRDRTARDRRARHRTAAAVAVAVGWLTASALVAQPSPEARTAFDEGLASFDAAQRLASDSPTEREEITRLYRASAESFRKTWQEGTTTVPVFVNAANAYYFAGDLAQSVLFYRRALALDPSDQEARRSLAHVRSELPIQKPQGAATSLARTLFFWHESFPPRLRRGLFSVLFVAGFVLLSVSLWRRRPFRVLGVICLVVSIAPLASLLVDALGGSLRNEAVVIVEVEGRSGDNVSYSPSHSRPFPPGTEVTVLETRSSSATGRSPDKRWSRVRLLDGSESWIPEDTIERVLARDG